MGWWDWVSSALPFRNSCDSIPSAHRHDQQQNLNAQEHETFGASDHHDCTWKSPGRQRDHLKVVHDQRSIPYLHILHQADDILKQKKNICNTSSHPTLGKLTAWFKPSLKNSINATRSSVIDNTDTKTKGTKKHPNDPNCQSRLKRLTKSLCKVVNWITHTGMNVHLRRHTVSRQTKRWHNSSLVGVE